MTRRSLRGLLLAPQPPLTLAYLIAVATYQHPPVLGPVVALAVFPATAVVGELIRGRSRSPWLLGLGVVELVWAAGAAAVIRSVAERLGG